MDRAGGVMRAAFGGRCPLQRGEAVEPFFIVGAPRSGTTLLRRILEAHPTVHVPPETHVLKRTIENFRRWAFLPWKMQVVQVLGSLEYHPQFDSFGVSLRPLAERLKNEPAGRHSLALILDAFYRYHAEQSGHPCERWGDKTPLNCFAMEQIASVFPRARFVHILRDGVDAVHSHVQAGLASDLDDAARRWRESVSAVGAYAAKHGGACHEVRYESLVAEPEPVVRRLCEFLGLPYDPGMIEKTEHAGAMGDVPSRAHHTNIYKPITTASLGKGRRELSTEQRQRLQGLIGAELRRWGYEPATAGGAA